MQKEVEQAKLVLQNGGAILYPSDTIWGLGCDASNYKAAQKIYKIKGRNKASSFIVLLHDPSLISKYVKKTPEILPDLIDSLNFPTTIIYDDAINLAKNVIAPDGSIAIRIIYEGFAYELLKAFGKPIVSTSANFSGSASPLTFKDIPQSLLDMVDFVATTGRHTFKETKASTIIKLKASGDFDIIRD